jgi:hypothetical protein
MIITIDLFAPIVMVISGIFCSEWLLERLLSVAEREWDLRLIIQISFLVGILDFITLAAYLANFFVFPLNPIIIVLLLAAGVILTTRAISEFSYAKWIAIAATVLSFIILWFGLFLLAAIIIAPIIFLIFYLYLKPSESFIRIVTSITSNPFVAIVVAVLCIVLGILFIFF